MNISHLHTKLQPLDCKFFTNKNRPKMNTVEKKVFIFEQIFAKSLGLHNHFYIFAL